MINSEPQPFAPALAPSGVDESLVRLTDAAAGKLRELTAGEANPNIGLRVYVYSGGCSGFRYGMMIEDAPTPEDRVLESQGIKVYVDTKSLDLLTVEALGVDVDLDPLGLE